MSAGDKIKSIKHLKKTFQKLFPKIELRIISKMINNLAFPALADKKLRRSVVLRRMDTSVEEAHLRAARESTYASGREVRRNVMTGETPRLLNDTWNRPSDMSCERLVLSIVRGRPPRNPLRPNRRRGPPTLRHTDRVFTYT